MTAAQNSGSKMKAQMKRFLIVAVFVAILIGSAKADLARQISDVINRWAQKKVQFSICIVEALSLIHI